MQHLCVLHKHFICLSLTVRPNKYFIFLCLALTPLLSITEKNYRNDPQNTIIRLTDSCVSVLTKSINNKFRTAALWVA